MEGETSKMIDFDLILDRVGHFGRYQIMLCSMVCWLGIPISNHLFSPVFFAAHMDYRCKLPEIEDALSNFTEEEALNLTTPYDASTGKFDRCQRYRYNESLCDSALNCIDRDSLPVNCDRGYHYDRSVFTETIISQWDLVCDNEYLPTIAGTLYFVGVMMSGPILGYCADRFGRKPTILCCVIGNVLFGIIASFAPWFPLFVVGRFFIGAFVNGEDVLGEVYMMEITSADKRAYAPIIAQLVITFGYLVTALVAFLLRNWRYFHLAISLTPVPFILFSFFIPESPRWHFSHSRNEIGKTITEKFAKVNGIKLTAENWEEAQMQAEFEKTKEKYSFVDLFKPRNMRWVTVKFMIIWFVVIHSYLSLSLNVESLSGDIFINTVLMGVISSSGLIFVGLTVNRTGRSTLLGGFLLITGVSSLTTAFIIGLGERSEGQKTATKIFYFVSFLGSWISVSITYFYTIEIFPTVVRSNGIGVSSFCGAVGSILAPIVNSSQKTISWFPALFLSVGALISGTLALSAPETTGVSMPQTIKEAEKFYKSRSKNLSQRLGLARGLRFRRELHPTSSSAVQLDANEAYKI